MGRRPLDPRYSDYCGTPEYRCWYQMISRCYNPKSGSFPRYGARGTQVCDLWRNDFLRFLADVGQRPSPKHSIDRIDSAGHYEPTNVKWSLPREQNRNRRSNVNVLRNGETKCIAAWAEDAGLDSNLVAVRLRMGWDIERALTEPVQKRSRHRTPRAALTLNGEVLSAAEWSRRTGLSAALICSRKKAGWTDEKILTTPPGKQGLGG